MKPKIIFSITFEHPSLSPHTCSTYINCDIPNVLTIKILPSNVRFLAFHILILFSNFSIFSVMFLLYSFIILLQYQIPQIFSSSTVLIFRSTPSYSTSYSILSSVCRASISVLSAFSVNPDLFVSLSYCTKILCTLPLSPPHITLISSANPPAL